MYSEVLKIWGTDLWRMATKRGQSPFKMEDPSHETLFPPTAPAARPSEAWREQRASGRSAPHKDGRDKTPLLIGSGKSRDFDWWAVQARQGGAGRSGAAPAQA